jgi:hypothetical protein
VCVFRHYQYHFRVPPNRSAYHRLGTTGLDKCGVLNISQPHRPSRPVTGMALFCNQHWFESVTHSPLYKLQTFGTEVRTFALDHTEWNWKALQHPRWGRRNGECWPARKRQKVMASRLIYSQCQVY